MYVSVYACNVCMHLYIACVYLYTSMSQHLCGEYKQFVGVNSLLPTHRSQKSKSGSQAWQQTLLPTEPSFTSHQTILSETFYYSL